MYSYFLIVLLSCYTLIASAQAPRPPVPQEGGRIEIPETGFSIVPPIGWDVMRNSRGSSLLFQAPKQTGTVSYQATIQVMTFQGHRYIDQLTQQEYGKLIVEKFSMLSNQVHNYRLRSEERIKLESGDEAILYYTEFNYEDIPIMQMHILVSAATHHFLMTYTDLAQAFENENSPALGIAYGSMHSALLKSKPPSRFRALILGGISLLLVIIAWFTSRFIRARRMARLGARLEEEENREIQADEESEYFSRHSPLSEVDETSREKSRTSARSKQAAPRSLPPKSPPTSIENSFSTRNPSTASSQSMLSSHGKQAPRPQSQPPTSIPGRPTSRQSVSQHGNSGSANLVPTPAARAAPLSELSSVPPPLSKPGQKLSGKAPTDIGRVTAPPTPSPEVASAPPVSVPKKKVQKATPVLDEDLSEEARLSQILPRAAPTNDAKDKKKRGLFWKKPEQDEEEPISEAWAMEDGKSLSADEDRPQTVSQAWALSEAGAPDGEGPEPTATSSVWALDQEAPVSELVASSVAPQADQIPQKKPSFGSNKSKDTDDEVEEGNWNLSPKPQLDDDEEEEVS